MRHTPTHGLSVFPPNATLLFLLVALLITNAGCVRYMAHMLYVLNGRDDPAEYDGLVEKKVAVLVSNNGVHTSDATSLVLSQNMNLLLQKNVKKIKMVGQDEVQRLVQDQQLGQVDPTMIGTRLGADYVINVDVGDLKLYEGKTLYKGKCSSTVTVYKCKDGTEEVFRKVFPEFIYPVNGAPVTDFDEATFRRVYLMTLAKRISRTFYPYDPATDVANEAAISSIGF